jgi:hypothetical protein
MAETKAGQPGSPEDRGPVQDYYVNSCGFTVSVYEFLLQFGIKTDQKSESQPLVNVRMSPQHAKVMAKLFLRNVQAYEREVGPIYLPQKLVQDLHLENEEKL